MIETSRARLLDKSGPSKDLHGLGQSDRAKPLQGTAPIGGVDGGFNTVLYGVGSASPSKDLTSSVSKDVAAAVLPTEKRNTWILLNHHANSTQGEGLKPAIEAALERNPDTNTFIGIQIEDMAGDRKIAKEVEAMVRDQGILPSEALTEATFRTHYPDHEAMDPAAADAIRSRYREAYAENFAKNPFNAKQYADLNDVVEKTRKYDAEGNVVGSRIVLRIESHDAELNARSRALPNLDEPIAVDDPQALEKRLEEIKQWADSMRGRDTDVRADNKALLEDPTVAEVVGVRGVGHGNYLLQGGYNTSVINADAIEGQEYAYPPMNELEHRLIDDPNAAVSADEVRLASEAAVIDWPADTVQDAVLASKVWYEDRLEVLKSIGEMQFASEDRESS